MLLLDRGRTMDRPRNREILLCFFNLKSELFLINGTVVAQWHTDLSTTFCLCCRLRHIVDIVMISNWESIHCVVFAEWRFRGARVAELLWLTIEGAICSAEQYASGLQSSCCLCKLEGLYFKLPLSYVSAISFFRSLPKPLDHRWGMEQRWTSKLKALPFF